MLILSVSDLPESECLFDGTIDQEGNTVQVTIPEGIDKSAIRPQVLVSAGAVVTPKSGNCKISLTLWNIKWSLRMERIQKRI